MAISLAIIESIFGVDPAFYGGIRATANLKAFDLHAALEGFRNQCAQYSVYVSEPHVCVINRARRGGTTLVCKAATSSSTARAGASFTTDPKRAANTMREAALIEDHLGQRNRDRGTAAPAFS